MIHPEVFLVKGPMGKGLGIKSTGVHVAFAAGTGVLVFLDLVTRIILHNTHVKRQNFDDTFKFLFFISHQNLNETMGMDLALKLMEMNQKLKINNFNLAVRLSEGHPDFSTQKPQRWSKDAIREQLKPFAN